MPPPRTTRPDFSARPGASLYGVYPARVVDNRDPQNQGRVKISAPVLDGQNLAGGSWARLATLMAGSHSGTWFIPDVDDEVLVVFEAGDASRPYVIGALWNAADPPPESMDGAGANNVKAIRSRNGVRLALDDTQGKESFTMETPDGQKITLKDGPGTIEIRDGSGNTIRLEAGGVTVTAAGKVTVNASAVEVSASLVTVNAPVAQFHGTVKADTLITNAVISASYTPGAGNIW